MLKFKSSDERRLYWLQENVNDNGKAILDKVSNVYQGLVSDVHDSGY